MAIIFNNPNGQMSGSVGANVYTRSASGKSVMRSRVKPVNPRTIAQSNARTLFSQASTAFVQLSDAIKMDWASIAASRGIKQGRWLFIKLWKQVLTFNQLKATAGTGLLPASQPNIDVSILNTPNSLSPDYNVTSGTASNVPILFENCSFDASANTLDIDVSLSDSTKNFTALLNSRSAKIAMMFEISVKKGQSKYLQGFVSVNELTQTPASASISLVGLKNSIPRSDYKYSVLAGDKLKVNCYLLDPSANCERTLYQEFNITAS